MACTFQATIGGKFAPLTGLKNDDMDTFNTAMIGAASEIPGNKRRWKKALDHQRCSRYL